MNEQHQSAQVESLEWQKEKDLALTQLDMITSKLREMGLYDQVMEELGDPQVNLAVIDEYRNKANEYKKELEVKNTCLRQAHSEIESLLKQAKSEG